MVRIKAQFGTKVEFAFILLSFANLQDFLQAPKCCIPVAF